MERLSPQKKTSEGKTKNVEKKKLITSLQMKKKDHNKTGEKKHIDPKTENNVKKKDEKKDEKKKTQNKIPTKKSTAPTTTTTTTTSKVDAKIANKDVRTTGQTTVSKTTTTAVGTKPPVIKSEKKSGGNKK